MISSSAGPPANQRIETPPDPPVSSVDQIRRPPGQSANRNKLGILVIQKPTSPVPQAPRPISE